MNQLKEAARLALDALSNASWHLPEGKDIDQQCEKAINALRAALALPDAEPVVPSIEAAYQMGTVGGSAIDAERLAFESWMRGHCWALCATWTGSHYRSDSEDGGDPCPKAMRTRQIWAAWRDRAALAAPQPAIAPETVMPTLLAKKHSGMRVNYFGLLSQSANALKRSDPGLAEMLRQLKGHITELGMRWYDGDVAVVDEILQLYCVEPVTRKAIEDAIHAKQGSKP